jgi:hypothetical protein
MYIFYLNISEVVLFGFHTFTKYDSVHCKKNVPSRMLRIVVAQIRQAVKYSHEAHGTWNKESLR